MYILHIHSSTILCGMYHSSDHWQSDFDERIVIPCVTLWSMGGLTPHDIDILSFICKSPPVGMESSIVHTEC